jgi:TetR/AcrR family transcriptional regulator, regulator of autoinduction and epiphytic fitness
VETRGAQSAGRAASSDETDRGPDSPAPAPDRRRLRGSRTRTAILEALIGLLDSGDPQPSSRAIAERAGVARRSVFHHFGDVRLLYLTAVELQAARCRALIAPIGAGAPLEERIRQVSRQRRELFERLGPVIRAASARVEDRDELEARLAELRLVLREQLEATFAPELRVLFTAADVLLDAVEVATGWAQWQALRFEAHHLAPTAEAVMAYAVARLLR